MIQKSDILTSALRYSQTESKISFSENNRTYVAENSAKKHILGFRVDGGLITSSITRKCDFALIVESDLCYLIELKGSGLDDACEQLDATLSYFEDKFQMHKFVGRVVVSRFNTHKIQGEKYKILERKLRTLQKSFNIEQKHLIISVSKMHDKI